MHNHQLSEQSSQLRPAPVLKSSEHPSAIEKMFIKGNFATKKGKIKRIALHFTEPQKARAVDSARGYLLRDHVKVSHPPKEEASRRVKDVTWR